MASKHILIVPGDGIGQEVTAVGKKVLDKIAKRFNHSFTYNEALIGHAAIEATGNPLPEESLLKMKQSDAVLFGAVGHPKYDNDPSAKVRPEQGLLRMRKELGLYANIRPIKLFDELLSASSIKPEILKGADILFFRELTGDLYFGEKGRKNNGDTAFDVAEYSRYEVERIARKAFEAARTRRKKLMSVDKANVLESSRLWRQIAIEVGKDNPDITLEHILVDTAAMRLVSSPAGFDVIVTENMFGDILTDEAAVLSGSMGLLPSASIRAKGPGLYEPIHGSAPDIAGKRIANPIGTILSAALLLRYSLHLEQEALQIEQAVEKTINTRELTPDLGGQATTDAVTQTVVDFLSEI